MTIHELAQELWVDTPKGSAIVLAWIDRGAHSDLAWLCCGLDGEVWEVKQYDIRVAKNWTLGIRKDGASKEALGSGLLPPLRDRSED
jgi:hypothetical protein